MKEESFKQWEADVQKSMIDPELRFAEVCIVLAGPTIVIEAIVIKASQNSKIRMDWGYMAGRAFVRTDGDVAKARQAILDVIPVHL